MADEMVERAARQRLGAKAQLGALATRASRVLSIEGDPAAHPHWALKFSDYEKTVCFDVVTTDISSDDSGSQSMSFIHLVHLVGGDEVVLLAGARDGEQSETMSLRFVARDHDGSERVVDIDVENYCLD